MLAQEANGLFRPGMAELGNDNAKVREVAGDFVEEEGPAKFQLALFSKGASRVNKDGHGQFFSSGVDAHSTRVARVEILVGGGECDAAKAQVAAGKADLVGRGRFGGVDPGEA